MTRRVVSRVVGGVGNQLFCYAAARRLALKSDAALCLDANFFRLDGRYQRDYRLDGFALPPHELRREPRLLPQRLDGLLARVERAAIGAGLAPWCDWVIEESAHKFEPRLLETRVTRETRLIGYWQDERYFADIAPQLRAELAFREAPAAPSELESRIADCEAVAVHCRRLFGVTADDPASVANALGEGYYLKAIEAIAARVARPVFFSFADEPRWLAARWPRGWPLTVVHHAGPRGELVDLRLMARCRHFIIANSTFSWWGAWLGSDPRKVVIAPRSKGLRHEVTSAAGWTAIDW